MKAYNIFLLTVVLCVMTSLHVAYGQTTITVTPSAGQNYIHTIVPQVETVSIPANPRDPSQYSETIEYFDGLGRPAQIVDAGASPNGFDMVTPYEYVSPWQYINGHEERKYLIYAETAANGIYRSDALTKAAQKYYADFNATDPFYRSVFETSPMERVIEEYGPGEWSDKRKTTEYNANKSNEIPIWKAYSDYVITQNCYAAGRLFVSEMKDEDNRTVIQFKDGDERVIRQQQETDSSRYAITDYVYDKYGQLAYVLPPAVFEKGLAAGNIQLSTVVSSELAKYIYAYRYDDFGRVIEKQIPGAGETYIIYNGIGDPILTQDEDQRTRNEWSYTKYDQFGRVAVTGILTNSASVATLRTQAYNATPYWEERNSQKTGYTNNAFPNTNLQELTVNFYDEYGFSTNQNLTYQASYVAKPKTMLTGTKVKILDSNTSLYTVFYYDEKGRIICTASEQIDNKWDKTVNTYDFTGKLLTSARNHNGNFTQTVTNNYDHAGRLMAVKLQMDNEPELTIAENEYDEFGLLAQTTIHEGLETIGYAYNIRGWLTEIDGENFSQKLHYQNAVSELSNTPQWAGNISAMEWETPALNPDRHAYTFDYDMLSRLKAGNYATTAGGTTYGNTDKNIYDENYKYDIMGNILELNRSHANLPVEELRYVYNGNQLGGIDGVTMQPTFTMNSTPAPGTYIACQSITLQPGFSFKATPGNSLSLKINPTACSGGGGGQYVYDSAGRMTHDNHRGIAIQYNHLGLVKQVNRNNQMLKNVYDATGRKLQTILPNGSTRTYIDGVEYTGSTLDFILTPFGRIRKNSADDWVHDYFLKDHLGSVRVVLTTDPLNTTTYRATMEEDRAAEEKQYFENVDATRADLPYNYPDRGPQNTKVSKVPGKSEGLKLTLKVMAGDTIEISAKAFYNMDNTQPSKSINVAPIIGAALAAMTNPIGTIGTAMGEGSQLANDLGAATSTAAASQSAGLFSIPQKNDQNNLVHPKSGINFVLYNSRFDVVDENTGYLPVDDKINAIQVLATDRIVMQEAGFLEVFVNNQARSPVYYDNLRVVHSAGSVMEVNSFYPYGKIIAGLSETSTYAPNRYKWNEQEYIQELDLEWHSYPARPISVKDVPVWLTPDKYSEMYYHLSPYSYCAGNPIKNIDINGDFIGTVVGTIVGGAAGAYDAYRKGNDVWAGAAEGALSGAIAGAAVDITIATAGTGLVLVGAVVAAGAAGGAVGAVAGDVAGQIVTNLNSVEGSTFSDAVSNVNTDNMVEKATAGAITGAVGGVVGGTVGALGKAAAASTKTVQSTMSKNITETAKTLTNMGADTKTVGTAVNKITTGMGEAGKNTVTTTNRVAAGTGAVTESAIKAPEIKIPEIDLEKLKK